MGKNKKHAPSDEPEKKKPPQWFPDLVFANNAGTGLLPDGQTPADFVEFQIIDTVSTHLGFALDQSGQVGEYKRKFVDCCIQRENDDPQYPCRPSEDFARIWLDKLVEVVLAKAWNSVPMKKADAVMAELVKMLPHSKIERFI